MKKNCNILSLIFTLAGAVLFVAGVTFAVIRLLQKFAPELIYGGDCCCDGDDWDDEWDDFDDEDDDEECECDCCHHEEETENKE